MRTQHVSGKLQQCCSSNTRNYNGNFNCVTATPATTLHATPPHGIGYSFIAAFSTKSNVNFTMTADSGASSHFIGDRLLPIIEHCMLNCVHLEPPAIIYIAGGYRLSGVGKGILIVKQGIQHPVLFPVTTVAGLGRHLFSRGTEATKVQVREGREAFMKMLAESSILHWKDLGASRRNYLTQQYRK